MNFVFICLERNLFISKWVKRNMLKGNYDYILYYSNTYYF